MIASCFLSTLQKGTPCKWMDTREVLIVNPTRADQVDPDYLETEQRLNKWYSLNPSKVIIATGFIASTPQNIPTTLKRDGSDFSAAIMGAIFRARQVTIWTDVDGVYSADPRKGLFCFLFHVLVSPSVDIIRWSSNFNSNNTYIDTYHGIFFLHLLLHSLYIDDVLVLFYSRLS